MEMESLNIKYHRLYFIKSFLKGLKEFQIENGGKVNIIDEDYSKEIQCIEGWFEGKAFESVMLNGIYWVLGGLIIITPDICKKGDNVDEQECMIYRHNDQYKHNHHQWFSFEQIPEIHQYQDQLILLIQNCYDSVIGGYRHHPDYPDSVVATMSAVQCLSLLNQYSIIQHQRPGIIRYVISLQDQITGSFFESKSATWTSEIDLRFCLCALVILHHLDALNLPDSSMSCDQSFPVLSIDTLISAILSNQNLDGGFGSRKGNESHSGHTYCAVACLALLCQLESLREGNRLDRLCRQD